MTLERGELRKAICSGCQMLLEGGEAFDPVMAIVAKTSKSMLMCIRTVYELVIKNDVRSVHFLQNTFLTDKQSHKAVDFCCIEDTAALI